MLHLERKGYFLPCESLILYITSLQAQHAQKRTSDGPGGAWRARPSLAMMVIAGDRHLWAW